MGVVLLFVPRKGVLDKEPRVVSLVQTAFLRAHGAVLRECGSTEQSERGGRGARTGRELSRVKGGRGGRGQGSCPLAVEFLRGGKRRGGGEDKGEAEGGCFSSGRSAPRSAEALAVRRPFDIACCANRASRRCPSQWGSKPSRCVRA
eukprot:1676284-Rhodomonas_salina.2